MRRFWPAMALVVAAAALAAGCGSSDDSSSEGTTAATDTTAAGGSASGTLTGSVGPGFDISMAETTVAAGTYTFVCDPHSSQMHGTLTVT